MLSRVCSKIDSKTDKRNGRHGQAATSSWRAMLAVLLLAFLCLLASLKHTNVIVREASRHVRHRGSNFIIAMATVQRPGDTDYVGNAVLSLYCALNVSHLPSTWPTVLVVNNQIPPAQHLAFEALSNLSHVQWYLQNGLSLEYSGTVHHQLHEPSFVLDMAARAAMPEHERQGKGDLGHNVDRFWWRCKEVLDAAYVLELGLAREPKAAYIIFLQDDVLFAGGFLKKLEEFTNARAAANETADFIPFWAMDGGMVPVRVPDPFSIQFGFVAIAIRRLAVEPLVHYLRARFTEMPLDWLVNHYIKSQNATLWNYQPSLVQHVGVTSSLRGKKQPATSHTFSDRTCWVEPPASP